MSESKALGMLEILRLMQCRELTATELVNSCLKKIYEGDEAVRAWVEVYEEQALLAEKKCDVAISSGEPLGSLHGIPIGIKDIIDVKDMWTRAGTEAYKPRMADIDAPVVSRLRAAGAIILGKTETTAFANNDPAVTRNPWNVKHTPGGSSSGSAAAVAAGMCHATLGTQTGGSILRPAAYTGLVGLKPTYSTINIEGVIPVSWSLDHIGPIASRVEEVKMLFEVLYNDISDQYAHMPTFSKHKIRSQTVEPFRLGVFRKFYEQEASESIVLHMESVCETLKKAGTKVIELDCQDIFSQAANAHRIIMETELSSYHWDNFLKQKKKYPPSIKKRIEKGRNVYGHEYVTAIHYRIAFQKILLCIFEDVDVAILPTAPSTAPSSLATTGSPIFCVPWSLAGFPAITLPSGLDDQGLPMAVQVVAKPYCEDTMFHFAAWCEQQLQFDFSPV